MKSNSIRIQQYIFFSLILLFYQLDNQHLSHLFPNRGSHTRPQEPSVQRNTISAAEGATGSDKEKSDGQCRPVSMGNRRRQVHAEIFSHGLLALL